MLTFIWKDAAAVLCTCDISGSEINSLLLLWLELDDLILVV